MANRSAVVKIRQHILLLPAVFAVASLCNISGCSRDCTSESTTATRPIDRNLYCTLGGLSIEECFNTRNGISVVYTPLIVGDEMIRSISAKFSKNKKPADRDILEIFSRSAAQNFRWERECLSINAIEDIWDGTDDSGIFPQTDTPSLRAQLSVPVLLNDVTAVVVADYTDCQHYYITKLIILEFHGEWRVRSSSIVAFA